MASYLNADGHKTISDAVRAAELKTSGEIVTVLADNSDGYSDIVLAYAALSAFAAMSIFTLWPDEILTHINAFTRTWEHEWTLGEIVTLVLAFGVAKFIGVWVFLQYRPLRYALIPPVVKSARVRDAAVKHFKVGANNKTAGRTGILIYLSMAERRAEIVADEAIAAKVEADVWGKAMADMLPHVKAGDIATGIAAAVADVGAVLAEHLPRADDDINELPDRLIEV